MPYISLVIYPGENTWIDGYRYGITEKEHVTYVELWTSNTGTWTQWKGQERLPYNWEYI